VWILTLKEFLLDTTNSEMLFLATLDTDRSWAGSEKGQEYDEKRKWRHPNLQIKPKESVELHRKHKFSLLFEEFSFRTTKLNAARPELDFAQVAAERQY
jgi:hypothetical protein